MKNVCYRCCSFLQFTEDKKWLRCICGVRVFAKEIITLEDLLTSSGKYKDREASPECTAAVRESGQILCNRINQLLADLNIDKVNVSSGFRTSEANASAPNSAKRSLHMSGKAVDLVDDAKQTLGLFLSFHSDKLKKYDLWIEDLESTRGWAHLDMGDRSDRPSRMFKP